MSSKKQNIFSALIGLGGVFILLFGLLMMNGLENNKHRNLGTKSTSFKITKALKKKKILNKIKPKPKKRKRPKVAPPKLFSGLNGASFGLEQFEFLGDAGDGLLGNTRNVIMTEETVDEIPKARYRAPIEYPRSARVRGIEGYVTLNMLIGTEGQVEEVKLLDSGPEGVFDSVTLASARDWQFDAASYQGKKVKVWVRQRISFNLN